MKVLLLIAVAVISTLADESHLLDDFASGSNKFSGEVYKELLKTNHDSFVVCPISVETVLTIVYTGAGGTTAEEISKTLHLPKSSENIQKTFTELPSLLQENQYFTLDSANKVYIQDGLKINDHFKHLAVNAFDADVQNIDFTKPDQAATEINRWIGDKTHDKIQDVVNPESLKSVVSVLVNAMYFNGKWSSPFKKDDTKKQAFYLNDQDKIDVDMMEQLGYFRYHESSELNAKLLEMPYASDERDFISMTIALPNDKDDLSALEARIEEVFNAIPEDEYNHRKVHTVVPKFKIETTIPFNSILQDLGIVEAFGPNADFKRIIDGQSLTISKVLQKAFIEVEEEGTTATAATVLEMIPESAFYQPPPPVEFIADHPFIFFIKIQDVVFFVGRYSS